MLNRHVLIYLIANGVPAAIGFGALISYTHLVNPSEYGLYVIGQGVAAIISMALFGWIRLSVSRYQAENEDVDVRGTVLGAFGATSVLATIVLIALLVVQTPLHHRLILATFFMAICLSAFEISQDFRRALFEPMSFAAVSVVRSVFGFALGVTAALLGFGGTGLLISLGTSFFLANVLFAKRIWRPRLSKVEVPKRQIGLLPRFIRYGVPLAISGIVFATYSAFDRLAVAYLIGQEAAGQYGVASDLARQMIGILAASVGAAVSPIAFRTLTVAGPEATRTHLSKSIELLLTLVAAAAIWLAVCSDKLSGTIIGSQFASSVAELLPVLAMARLFGAITNFYVHLSFQLVERPMLQLGNELLVLSIYLITMIPLAKGFGLGGAATAALISEFSGLLFGFWLSRRGFPLPVAFARLIRVGIALMLMALSMLAAKTWLGGSPWTQLVGISSAGIASYAVALMALDVTGVRTIVTAWWLRSWTRGLVRPAAQRAPHEPY